MPDLLSYLPNNIIIPTAIVLILFNFYSFAKASSIEKSIENKKYRLLRKLTEDSVLYFDLLIIILCLNPEATPSTKLLSLVMILFISFSILSMLPQSFIKRHTKFAHYYESVKLRIATFIVYYILAILLYIDLIQSVAYIIKNQHNTSNTYTFMVLFEAFNKDVSSIIVFLVLSLICFCIIRALIVLPLNSFSANKLNGACIDVVMKEGKPINNVYLIESFDNYYVFYDSVVKSEVKNKYVINKDNINYLNFK